MAETDLQRRHYFARLWHELGRLGGEHDAFIKVIIVERIAKAIVLVAIGIGLLVAGQKGWLDNWAEYAQDQLNLTVGRNIILELLLRALVYVGAFTHITLLAISAMAYAALEATEGVGLAMRRRWAEYLTVIATNPDSLRGLRGNHASDPLQGWRPAPKPGCGGLPGLSQALVCRHLTSGSASCTESLRGAAHSGIGRRVFAGHIPSTS